MAEQEEDNGVYRLNSENFWQRIQLLHASWMAHRRSQTDRKPQFPGWNNCDCILVCCGHGDDNQYKRNNAIYLWLFGFELLNAILIITEKTIFVCGGDKICTTLKQLNDKAPQNGLLNLQLITKEKEYGYRGTYSVLVDIIKSSHGGKLVGYIEEQQTGKYIPNFIKYIKDNSFQIVSFSEALSDIMMVKDNQELGYIRKIGEFSSFALKHFQKQMEQIIEEEKKISHYELAQEIIRVLDNPKIVKASIAVKKDHLDLCYDPIIQSGGNYKLKPSIESDHSLLHYEYGTIIVMLGFRLRDYCSNIARTFLIDASESQKEIYNILIAVYKRTLLMLRNNIELYKVYETAIKTIRKSTRPELEEHFLKNCGWGIGLEFRDKNYLISKKNFRQAKSGMTFNIQVGFENLVDEDKQKRGLEKAAKYSLILADTVIVTDDHPDFVTRFTRKLIDYQLAAEGGTNEEQKEEKILETKPSQKDEPNDSNDQLQPMDNDPYRRVTRQSNRRTAQELKEKEQRRLEREKNQSMLREKAKKHLEKLLRDSGGNFGLNSDEKEWEDPLSYSNVDELPVVKYNHVSVDLNHNCILCPIMDHLVPFHVNTIKNCSVSTSGEWTYLRVNFISPVATSARNSKQPEVALLHSDAMFIKELTYRSKDGTNFQAVFRYVKELQKKAKQRAKQDKEQPLVKQDKLQRITNTNSLLMLKDLTVRPNLGGRKKGTGRLECHTNGFRYTDHKKNEIHILYNNIKHAFYQPAENTAAVIIHFHLKNPILIGKKPSQEVQVFRDVIERFEEIGRSGNDYDGVRQEQEERKRIVRFNKQFKEFVDKAQLFAKSNGYDLEFDIPEMDLGFTGVPNKQAVTIYPSARCLVSLEDSPAFCISLKDVEIAHFERVQFSLKNFDLVFVFKDFLKEPIRISTIPREHLETLQDFLNWQGVLHYQGKMNLDWKEIMRMVRENLESFIENGGWDFLKEEHNDEDNNNNKNEDGQEIVSGSEYAPSGEEDGGSEDEEDDDDDEDDEYQDVDDEDEDESYENEEEDNGETWEELDRKAMDSDKKARIRERNNEFIEERSPRDTKRRRK